MNNKIEHETVATVDDIFEKICHTHRFKNKKWYLNIYDDIDIFFYRYFINPMKDFKYWLRDTIYLLKTKQIYQSSWSIDDALLDVLLHNIPILKKNKHTLSWKMLDKAILEKHKNEKNFNLGKVHEDHIGTGYGAKIEDRSVELEHELFDELILTIKKYRYYSQYYEFIDEKNIEQVELDKQLRSTIPMLKKSSDKIDYNKLNKLTDKYWKRIWEIVCKYGREFND